jgi:regulator of telomere elongation helicase 1
VKKEEKSVPVPKTADIEDLVMLGRKENICPFFFSRDLLQDAEIIFTPYNYLIDPKFRKRSGINVKDNIIIFDEAHNIEKTCTESASFDFHCAHIGQAIGEIMIAIKSVNEYKENQFESKLTITRPVDELLQALNTTKGMKQRSSD